MFPDDLLHSFYILYICMDMFISKILVLKLYVYFKNMFDLASMPLG